MISNQPVTAAKVWKSLTASDRALLERILQETEYLVIFGSRAMGVHSVQSDFDVFCIDAHRRRRSGNLDIVSRERAELYEGKWLGSELASHIAANGIVVGAKVDWIKAVKLSEEAVEKKAQRVVKLVEGLWNYWERLDQQFQTKYLTTIRREVQRLDILRNGQPVPATPILDGLWKEFGVERNWLGCFQWLEFRALTAPDHFHRTIDVLVSRRDALNRR